MSKNLTAEQLEKRKNTNKKIIKFGCLPIIVIFILIGILTKSSDQKQNTKTESADHSSGAYLEAQKLAKEKLNFPDEADFDWTPAYDKNEGEDNYRIVGKVLSKNAFGVKKKMTFKCVLHYKGGDELTSSNWDIIQDVTFED